MLNWVARAPNTLLVGPEGGVEKVWPGRLDEAGWNALFTYFDEMRQTASLVTSQTGRSRRASEIAGVKCFR